MKTCSVPGCGRKHHAKGYCSAHRQQVARNGERGSAEYNTWRAMIARCYSAANNRYPYYGARGVTVCARWRKYENFLADMGRKPGPGYSIERVDTLGNYEAGNCRWATATEQARNKRTTKRRNLRRLRP